MKKTARRNFLGGLPLLAAGPAILHSQPTAHDLKSEIDALPLFDSHEHLLPESQRVKNPADLFTLISHYTLTDLVSTGLDTETAKSLYSKAQSTAQRWKIIAPWWERGRNTGYARALRLAVRDIYGVEEINEKTCETISERIQAANRPGLYKRVLTDMARIETAVLDDYWNARPTRPEGPWFVLAHKFDRFIQATSRQAIEALEKACDRSITRLQHLEAALTANFESHLAPEFRMVAVKCALAYNRPIHFREVRREDAEREFERVVAGTLPPPSPHPWERETQPVAAPLQDYMFHRVIQLALEHHLPVQIHTGILAGNKCIVPNTNPTLLLNVILDYPGVKFDLFHASYPYIGELAALAKSFPNVYADMCWVHVISPEMGRRALSEFLETVPGNKILAFGGDYRHPELSYAHSVMARDVVARVLAEKIQSGFMTEPEALEWGRRILYENGKELFLSGKNRIA